MGNTIVFIIFLAVVVCFSWAPQRTVLRSDTWTRLSTKKKKKKKKTLLEIGLQVSITSHSVSEAGRVGTPEGLVMSRLLAGWLAGGTHREGVTRPRGCYRDVMTVIFILL